MMNRIEPRLPRGSHLLIVAALSAFLASCGDGPKPAPPLQLLASDLHVVIAGTVLTLPFAALEDHAYRRTSFSLGQPEHRNRVQEAVDSFVDSTRDSDNPLMLRDLSIVVRTYGWNDADMRQREMCPLLNRAWAQSVCDNPWAAVQQALPANYFQLVDLRQLSKEGADRLLNCVEGSQPLLSVPKTSYETALVCRAEVYPTSGSAFHKAVVRLDGDLGAVWTVWGYGQNGESAEAMAHREGIAIASFVRNGIGSVENFPALHQDMCGLRRPGSVDSPKGADC
jgi:hypothetical protein